MQLWAALVKSVINVLKFWFLNNLNIKGNCDLTQVSTLNPTGIPAPSPTHIRIPRRAVFFWWPLTLNSGFHQFWLTLKAVTIADLFHVTSSTYKHQSCPPEKLMSQLQFTELSESKPHLPDPKPVNSIFILMNSRAGNGKGGCGESFLVHVEILLSFNV